MKIVARNFYSAKNIPVCRWFLLFRVIDKMKVILTAADVFNTLMAIPNLIGLILLPGVVTE